MNDLQSDENVLYSMFCKLISESFTVYKSPAALCQGEQGELSQNRSPNLTVPGDYNKREPEMD